ncbi:MAG: universal stress protein [Desulfovibrionaceae bacterium]|nr:universal stress protein [Desulfovibrionaceae bacterium]
MFRKIILAATPGEQGLCAADMAFSLAARANARLIVFHACCLPSSWWGKKRPAAMCGEMEQVLADMKQSFQDKASGTADVSFQVVPGQPPEEILKLAGQERADLIVMGPHARDADREGSALVYRLIGSTAEKVSRQASCPVMIVSRRPPETGPKMSRILLATDFSSPSENALRYACMLAGAYDAELHVFHVINVAGYSPVQEQPCPDIEVLIAEAKDRMRRRYGHLLGRVRTVFESWEGTPPVEILKYARWNDVGCIVMAHHSSDKGPERTLIGSTAAYVALTPSCPTVLINYKVPLCPAA